MEGKNQRGGNMEGKIDQANQTDERSTEEKCSKKCIRADKAYVNSISDDTRSQIVEKEDLLSDKEVNVNEVKEPERKKLTDLEAAIIIQSAYRGFAIRRWEPQAIKKVEANCQSA